MQRLNPTTIMIIAGAALLLLLGLLFLRPGNEDQDKLTRNVSAASASADDPEKRCASQGTYDLIKRELFRRAAQVRGSDEPAFARLADYASLRVERPVLESENEDRGEVSCSGALSLDLPPGVAVAGGRRTLSADVDYQLRRAADRSGEVLTLGNADAIITPLATLARTRQASAPQPPASQADTADDPAPLGSTPAPQPQHQPAPVPTPDPPRPPEPVPTATARPSFNCANARTRGEVAVCRDSGLATLDRQMAAQFNSAMANASPGERAMLVRSRNRFLNFRDRCGSDACMADAYKGRMAEIRDIMSGQYRP